MTRVRHNNSRISEQREQARKERFRQWAKRMLRGMDEENRLRISPIAGGKAEGVQGYVSR